MISTVNFFRLFIFLIVAVSLTITNNHVKGQDKTELQTELAQLKASTESLVSMPLKVVIEQVPVSSGIFFTGCPACGGGAQEMKVFNWEPEMGDTIQCRYCEMIFPNDEYPDNHEKVIKAPGGYLHIYRYYKSPEGNEHYFQAHAWYKRWQWIRSKAVELARLWTMTSNNIYGDRAAAILGRFAEVFPDYAVRFDYPHRPVQFFPADQKWPYPGLNPYRGAKWYWWGYGDIPIEMATAYEQLSNYDWSRLDTLVGPKTQEKVVSDLLRLGYEFTAANPETYTNMSPGMYKDMIELGRIIDDSTMINEGLGRFQEFMKSGFFTDGWWKEGTVSYHDQTVNNLNGVLNALKKANRVDIDNTNEELAPSVSLLNRALAVSNEAVLPNGRKIPINDTWPYRYRPQKKTEIKAKSKLWPALGNAILNNGRQDDQVAINLNWSGNYGHSHYDNGSIILFGAGEELLSDIGYTHTKSRSWTVHTASHNTVVIDQVSQDAGGDSNTVKGNLLFFDDRHPNVKVIDLDASPAYKSAKTYRRRIVLINAGAGRTYAIDLFDVEGGNVHDYFLHGMAEEEGDLQLSIKADHPVESLVPEWGGNNFPETQYDFDLKGEKYHPYAFLQDIKSGTPSTPWTAMWQYKNSGLRTHHLTSDHIELYQFKSQSVRRAEEDDNKLQDYLRNGIMLRQVGGVSSFLVVHEPFRDKPWIDTVFVSDNRIIVQYEINGELKKDDIIIEDQNIKVTSDSFGNYDSGRPTSGKVMAMQVKNGSYKMKLDAVVPDISYIRLHFSDGSTHFYPVKEVADKWIELSYDPGFILNNKGDVKYHTFPHAEYGGPLKYTFFK